MAQNAVVTPGAASIVALRTSLAARRERLTGLLHTTQADPLSGRATGGLSLPILAIAAAALMFLPRIRRVLAFSLAAIPLIRHLRVILRLVRRFTASVRSTPTRT